MMNTVATARTKAGSLVSTQYLLPSVLALNTAALFAVNLLGGLPNWLKTAAALFLSF